MAPRKRNAAAAEEKTLPETGVKPSTAEQPPEKGDKMAVEAPPAKANSRRKRGKVLDGVRFHREKRNMEDLWRAAFPVGTEWDNIDKLQDIDWSFSHLESAFEEGGELYGKKVYMFGCTEADLLTFKSEENFTIIPIVVVVVSPIPPSDKIGLKSVQREKEDIIPMKAMKMAWVPYIPLEKRLQTIDRMETQIFTLGCTQRRSALKLLKEERVKQYDYCLPYLQSLEPDEDEERTEIDIIFPWEPPVLCEYDWEFDDLEEITDNKIKADELPEDQKESFKAYVKEQVKERKKILKEVPASVQVFIVLFVDNKESRRKAMDDMDETTRKALREIKFYKFYPEQSPDTPAIKSKSSYINRYYGKAHVVR